MFIVDVRFYRNADNTVVTVILPYYYCKRDGVLSALLWRSDANAKQKFDDETIAARFHLLTFFVSFIRSQSSRFVTSRLYVVSTVVSF